MTLLILGINKGFAPQSYWRTTQAGWKTLWRTAECEEGFGFGSPGNGCQDVWTCPTIIPKPELQQSNERWAEEVSWLMIFVSGQEVFKQSVKGDLVLLSDVIDPFVALGTTDKK